MAQGNPMVRAAWLLVCVTLSLPTATAQGGAIAPHRALYDLSLASSRASGGVVGVQGRMLFEWGDSCDGWTVEQRYRMFLSQAQEDEVEIVSSLASWESKDGLRYRFTLRKKRGDEPEEEVRGTARLEGAGRGGYADFTRPEETRIDLPRGTMFPTAHTIEIIRRAEAREAFFSRRVFDGSEVEKPGEVNTVIGRLQPADPEAGRRGKLLDRPGWRVRLAFFPAEGQAALPEYEIGLNLLDNGVSSDMLIDYGDFTVRARLKELEAVPTPGC
ncbi:MAG: cell envelope integrity EipB family protein [Alphaproteobacteria bacterium]|nr:cell envelope integrity EipB family protein [Alphaproteobacteria bacterium]